MIEFFLPPDAGIIFKVVNKGILTLQMCTCSTFDSLLPVVTIPACFLTLIIYLQFIDVVGSLASRIKLLGVTVDSHLYMFKQTKLMSQYCFYHISYTAVAIALTLVSSRLDYANSVLYGSPAKNISAEGLECGSNSCNTKASTLCLQSLPVQWLIKLLSEPCSLTLLVSSSLPSFPCSQVIFLFSPLTSSSY